MNGTLIDSNVILDLFLDDPDWSDWSKKALTECGDQNLLYINWVIYTEISIGFERIETLENALQIAAFEMLDMPKEALFLAGKAFIQYKQRTGLKTSPMRDFYIGAHAAVMNLDLLTRDESRYRTNFPTVNLITP